MVYDKVLYIAFLLYWKILYNIHPFIQAPFSIPNDSIMIQLKNYVVTYNITISL